MSSIVNDGTLVRGSIKPTIGAGGPYIFLNFDDDGAQAASEEDFNELGKPNAASHREGFRKLTGVIRARSDQAAPAKFTAFTYDSINMYIVNRRYTGSTEGLKEYAVECMELINASLVTT